MNWEKLTVVDFKKAIKRTRGVCILPLGVLEKHGNHLPLGTDALTVHRIASLAAEIEPAMVFPAYYFAQILEAKHKLGTIAIKPGLMIELLENVCDEIGRNGFKKIILLNGHGGNIHLILFFVRTMLDKKKSYMIYYPKDVWETVWPTVKITNEKKTGHAGEAETSIMLAIAGELVKKNYISKPGIQLKRLRHLKNISTPISWYADYPEHYSGDAQPASLEKGKKLLKPSVEYVVKIIRTVKKDKVAKKLYDEFFSQTNH